MCVSYLMLMFKFLFKEELSNCQDSTVSKFRVNGVFCYSFLICVKITDWIPRMEVCVTGVSFISQFPLATHVM